MASSLGTLVRDALEDPVVRWSADATQHRGYPTAVPSQEALLDVTLRLRRNNRAATGPLEAAVAAPNPWSALKTVLEDVVVVPYVVDEQSPTWRAVCASFPDTAVNDGQVANATTPAVFISDPTPRFVALAHFGHEPDGAAWQAAPIFDDEAQTVVLAGCAVTVPDVPSINAVIALSMHCCAPLTAARPVLRQRPHLGTLAVPVRATKPLRVQARPAHRTDDGSVIVVLRCTNCIGHSITIRDVRIEQQTARMGLQPASRSLRRPACCDSDGVVNITTDWIRTGEDLPLALRGGEVCSFAFTIHDRAPPGDAAAATTQPANASFGGRGDGRAGVRLPPTPLVCSALAVVAYTERDEKAEMLATVPATWPV